MSTTGIEEFTSVATKGGPKLLLAVPVAEPGAELASATTGRRARRQAAKSKAAKSKVARSRRRGRPVVAKAGKGVVLVALIAAVVTAVRKLPARATTRHLVNRSKGLAYRAMRRQPSGAVDDKTLADRIRSELGPLEHRLEVPHVNVMVENHVAVLHGEVGSEDNVRQIVEAVSQIPGVHDVRSHLRPTG